MQSYVDKLYGGHIPITIKKVKKYHMFARCYWNGGRKIYVHPILLKADPSIVKIGLAHEVGHFFTSTGNRTNAELNAHLWAMHNVNKKLLLILHEDIMSWSFISEKCYQLAKKKYVQLLKKYKHPLRIPIQ